MMLWVSRQHFGVGVALAAWLLLAVHLCSDPSEAHNLGPVDSHSHAPDHADASPSKQAPDGDCHSAAWLNHDRVTFGSPSNAHSFGPPVAVTTVVQPGLFVLDVLERTTRASDSSPPPLYLLHAALLI
jgi:hypothetical protein